MSFIDFCHPGASSQSFCGNWCWGLLISLPPFVLVPLIGDFNNPTVNKSEQREPLSVIDYILPSFPFVSVASSLYCRCCEDHGHLFCTYSSLRVWNLP